MIDNDPLHRSETDRDTEEIAPLIPILPAGERATAPSRTDGSTQQSETSRPPQTDYATTYDQGSEEIEPLVPDLR